MQGGGAGASDGKIGRGYKLFTEVAGHDGAPVDATLRDHPATFELAEWAMALSCAISILVRDLGFARSAELGQPVDRDGNPVPMYSYSLIEYLAGLDLSSKSVFEFGAGNSTLFWAERAKQVRAAESDAEWVQKLNAAKARHCSVDLVERGAMPGHFRGLETRFDIIVVDCAENRFECCRLAREHLNPGGFIILDNSDWYPNSAKLLRASDLIQIDFHGLRPCHHYACTTSMFIDRAFTPSPRRGRLPLSPLGGKKIVSSNWDCPVEGDATSAG